MKTLSLSMLLAAAPAAANLCSTADQAGYLAARNAAAGRVTATNVQVEAELGKVAQYELQFDALVASQWMDEQGKPHPESAGPLQAGISALRTQLEAVKNGAAGYLTAAGADMGGAVSARHATLRGSSTTGATGATGAATALRAVQGLDAVQKPTAAKTLAGQVKTALQTAAGLADQSATALNDAGSQHGLMGDCAGRQETAMNSEQENLDKNKDKKDGGAGMPSPPANNQNQDKKPLPEKKKVNIVRNSNEGVYMGSIAPEGNQPRPATFSSQPIGLTQR